VPDASVFSPGITFDQDTVASRLRELAFLNAGATMKLRLLKHGQPLPTAGSSGGKAAAPADKAQRRSKKSTSQQEAAAVEAAGGALAASNGSNGTNGGQAVAEQQDWQVFCFQEGLKEYVQW